MLSLKVKRLHPEASLPRYETEGAAGMDLTALEAIDIPPGEWRRVRTGLALEIPNGYEGQVRPRSGLAMAHGVTVLNAPGTIDSDYRGEVMVALINFGKEPYLIKCGERMAQLVLCPVSRASIVAVEELETTDRGAGGFGSTGR